MGQAILALRYAVYDTAAGDVTLIAAKKSLRALLFGARDPSGAANEENTVLYDAIVQLNQFFFGQRRSFDVPLAPFGGEKEQRVYAEVQKIPYGETRTYKEIAKSAGLKDGKEVEKILALNPLPFFIPCHRVIKDEKDLGSYVGGDHLKEKLIQMEQSKTRKMYRPGHYLDPRT